MEKEKWRDLKYITKDGVKDFTGLYQVSNLGRVRSVDRKVNGNGYNQKDCFKEGVVKVPFEDNSVNKYQQVFLWKSNKRIKCKIHIMVAQNFPEICGEWFEGAEVHHKDCNPHNNSANNILVCTKEQHKEIHKHIRELKKFDYICDRRSSTGQASY